MIYTEEFKRYIEVMTDFCLEETGHSEYMASLKFMDSPHEDDTEDCHTRMSILINPTYLYFTIRVYPDCVVHYENGDYETLAGYVLHEVCHLFVKPIEDLFWWDMAPSQEKEWRETSERQVQRICNALMVGFGDEWYLPEEE